VDVVANTDPGACDHNYCILQHIDGRKILKIVIWIALLTSLTG